MNSKPVDTSIFDHIWATPTITVNSVKAKGNISGLFNYYGPYTIESTDLTLEIAPAEKPPNYAIVNGIDGDVVSSVKVNEPFYIRFDNKLISDINITFLAQPLLADVKVYGNYIYMYRGLRNVHTQLTIGNQSRVGKVMYMKYDGVTKSAIPGTVVEIRDKSGNFVTSLTTDDKGEVLSPDLQVGDYYLTEVKATSGYLLDETKHPISIQGNGAIINITSEARPVNSIVNFVATDKATTAPVGGSIFDIVDSNEEVVSRIGFDDTGKCSNIRLDEGKYYLRETNTHLSYQLITTPIFFEAVAGEVIQIDIPKTSAFTYTDFAVKNDHDEIITNATLELYKGSGEFITYLKTDNLGGLTLSLPVGEYYVSTYGGNTMNFNVTAADNSSTPVFVIGGLALGGLAFFLIKKKSNK